MSAKMDRCVFRRNGVLCANAANCGTCGWNPRVERERVQKLQEHGKNALVRNVPEEDEKRAAAGEVSTDRKIRAPLTQKEREELGRYIVEHDKAFGGSLSGQDIREKFHVSAGTYSRVKRATVAKLSRAVLGIEVS